MTPPDAADCTDFVFSRASTLPGENRFTGFQVHTEPRRTRGAEKVCAFPDEEEESLGQTLEKPCLSGGCMQKM